MPQVIFNAEDMLNAALDDDALLAAVQRLLAGSHDAFVMLEAMQLTQLAVGQHAIRAMANGATTREAIIEATLADVVRWRPALERQHGALKALQEFGVALDDRDACLVALVRAGFAVDAPRRGEVADAEKRLRARLAAKKKRR